jgi:Cu2+-exporting ATPase
VSLPARESQPCPHCGAPVEAEKGGTAVFCCPGCQTAHAIITGAGLGDYYTRRVAPAPRPDAAPPIRIEAEVLPSGESEARFFLDGLRCASCVWVSERILTDSAGVTEARVSYADGRASLRFDPEQTDLESLLSQLQALGYSPRAISAPPQTDRALISALGIASFCAMNVMMLSIGVYMGWFSGMSEIHSALFRWTVLALATPSALYAARPFTQRAISGLKQGVLHMDLPVSLGVWVLYLHGVLATIQGHEGYLDSMTMLVALLLGGRLVEKRGRQQAARSSAALSAFAPHSARRVTPEGIEAVSPESLCIGDLVEVGPGEALPADGVVASGHGRASMSLITGESEPVSLIEGVSVVAGSILRSGHLQIRVSAAGGQTLLAGMIARLEEATAAPGPPRLTDRLAPWFVGVTLLLAVVTAVGSLILFGEAEAIQRTVAVLVVACPCALALAWPLSVSVGLGAAASRGLILTSGDALAALADIDLIAIDKTGTLTGGTPAVTSADDQTLRIAAGIERASSHPVARAIIAEALKRGIPLPVGQDITEEIGAGISGVVDGVEWSIRSGGPGAVALEADGEPLRLIHLTDTPRPDAAAAIAGLSKRCPVVMLTGDTEAVGARIAAAVGITTVHTGMKPGEKADWIAARQAEGRRVLFIGDGLNDGPALATAAVGLAMGGGSAPSIEAADGVIASDRLAPVLSGLHTADRFHRAVRIGLRTSLLYNLAAVSAAMLGVVNPLVAAILMPISSAMVLLGALSIRR